jgi:methyl-accepting chemotaxis protein
MMSSAPQAEAAPGRRSPARWFADRRVATKILVVAAVAVAGTLATGLLSLSGVGDLQATRSDEVGRAVPYITNLNAAALSAKAAANDERGYLVAGDVSFRDDALGRKADVDAKLAAASAVAEGDAKATVQRIQAATDTWFAALRQEFETAETDRAAAVAIAFGANRDLRKAYEELLAAEITRADQALIAGKAFDASVASTMVRIAVLLGVALMFAVALAVHVGRLIVRPLRRVSAVLDAVAGGDLTGDPQVPQRDELGDMADALRRATANLRATITAIGDHAITLSGASEELAVTSRHSADSAGRGARQAAGVADAAAAMSHNIQTVAAGAEEVGVSIREISRSATEAAGVAARAVEVTGTTGTVMAQLGDSSAEIGNVVKVITAIAEQTNLLALNATIEAARAGDAGKGFAVVASEVKELAQETARATEDISTRVAAIQSDTGGAVGAIAEISEIINRISEFQTTIASAVEEQTVTTQEMTRNVSEAAQSGTLVADTIVDVAEAVRQTTDGAAQADEAAGQLATMSGELRTLVGAFRV